jgi:ferric-dicitrate binding protein FerR (iron transport regulator)
MNQEKLKKLLDLYMQGKCSPEQKQFVEDWFESLGADQDYSYTEREEEIIGKKVKGRIDQEIGQRKPNRILVLRIAACFLIISSLALLLFVKDTLRFPAEPPQYATTGVPKLKKLKLTLNDGSTVILNSGSEIKYPKKFSSEIREVFLIEGEAFFDIKHDEKRPFLVHTKQSHTQVLGTAFNIRAYKALKDVQITVTRGKVAVSADGDTKSKGVFLFPNEQAVLHDKSPEIEKRSVISADLTGWISGRMQFNNETLFNATIALGNAYGVEFEFAQESLKAIRFSANFHATEPLDEILFAIAEANKLKYSKKDKRIKFEAINRLPNSK